MGSLYKRENGIYYMQLKDTKRRCPRCGIVPSAVAVCPVCGESTKPRYIRISTGTTRKPAALKLLRAAEEGILADQIQMKVAEAIGFDEAWEFYEMALKPLKKPRVLYNEKIAWNQFKQWCIRQGIVTLEGVKVGDVALWQAELLDIGRSPVGVNTYMRMCKLVFGHLLRLERVEFDNPFRKVRQVKEDRKVKFHPWPDVVRLVETARSVGRDIHLMFILGAYGGLRKAEILSVRWKHVEWDKGQLLVEGTKTAASRNYIPLHQALHDALLPYWPGEEAEAGDSVESPYIVAPHKTEPPEAVNAYRWNCRNQWAKVEQLEVAAATEEGRKPVFATPHQLRHSVATHLLDIGYTIQQVAVFLRHANDVPTRRYADLKGVELEIKKF